MQVFFIGVILAWCVYQLWLMLWLIACMVVAHNEWIINRRYSLAPISYLEWCRRVWYM